MRAISPENADTSSSVIGDIGTITPANHRKRNQFMPLPSLGSTEGQYSPSVDASNLEITQKFLLIHFLETIHGEDVEREELFIQQHRSDLLTRDKGACHACGDDRHVCREFEREFLIDERLEKYGVTNPCGGAVEIRMKDSEEGLYSIPERTYCTLGGASQRSWWRLSRIFTFPEGGFE